MLQYYGWDLEMIGKDKNFNMEALPEEKAERVITFA